MRLRFLTSTPLDVRRGSGTYVGIRVLADALETLGHTVVFETSGTHLPVYTAERLLFNRRLRASSEFDLTVGFDMDGYRIAAGSPSHVASLKGVIADEVRFERGLTRLTMSAQAACERRHVLGAARVLATSRYSADRAREFYGLPQLPLIVPELIDLAGWRGLIEANPAQTARLTILFVGRLYRRKRVEILLRAIARLRHRVPDLEVRIVGDGPRAAALRRESEELGLAGTVAWLGDVTRSSLAAEYNRAQVFCLPSVQEGFGIVLLEAMAAGCPIVASRAAAIPEVAPHGLLVEPEEPEAFAAAIESLWRSPARRSEIAHAGRDRVRLFDAPAVARRFLEAANGAQAAESSRWG